MNAPARPGTEARSGGPNGNRLRTAVRRVVRDVLTAYSAVLFLNCPYAGGLCLAATLMSPKVGIVGVAAAIAAGWVLRLLPLSAAGAGLARVNALLVGLALGTSINAWTPLLPLWILTGAVLAVMTSAVLIDWFWRLDRMSPFCLPFVLSAGALAAVVTRREI